MCRKGYDIFMNAPTVEEFMKKFRTEKDALNFIVEHIFPEGKIICPRCGCSEHIFKNKQRIRGYQCGHCHYSITPTIGTIFELSPIPLKTWLYVIYTLFISRRSISNYQLMRQTHLAQETVTGMRRLIQAAMGNYKFDGFSGVVQIDEAFVGGSNHGRYGKSEENEECVKYPVLGIYDQINNKVYSTPAISDDRGRYLTKERLKYFLDKTCKPGTTVVTDEWRGYNFLNVPENGYHHETVDHSSNERTNINGYTTNGIEGYWGGLKKMYYSTHSNLPREWIHLYLTESDFRYNHNEYEEAIDTILEQAVFTPRVIDIRRMGRFANKYYNLNDYRMILPKCFDNRKIDDIKLEEILLCEEPVYGILREEYQIPKRTKSRFKFPREWYKFGLVPNYLEYKDYQKDNVTNTIDDVMNMLNDAKKHKEVNKKYFDIHRKAIKKASVKKPEPAYKRKWRVKKAYDNLPAILQTQIKQEYPNMFRVSNTENTREIHCRIKQLSQWYRNNEDFLGA